ncbi:MAG: serine hydrolase domain-containing protein [Bacteroidota bacterium]
MRKTTTLILISSFMILDLFGQSSSIEKIDSLITEMTHLDLFSGAILIADSSKVLLSKGYGFSDRENNIKNTPDTRFDLSSGSKIFTGIAITYLAQQEKIKFTDSIGQYIEGLPKGNIITIHQILTHSAGFDNFYNAKGFSYKNVKNCTDIMPFMRSLPLVYNPGDSCLYSTGDCMVLGAVVEKITGMNFQDYIKTTFIDPLDLRNTCFTPYWTLDESQKQYAIGYVKNDSIGYARNAYNYDYGFIPLSAGGAWSSINDLYKFDKAAFSGEIVNDEYLKIMTTKYTQMIAETYKLEFGYIWLIDDSNTKCVRHAGNSSGWNTWNYYYPEKKTTIIILTNFGSVDVFDLSAKIDRIIFKKE